MQARRDGRHQGITGYPAASVRFGFVVRDGRISRIGRDWNAGESGPNVHDQWIEGFVRERPEFRRMAATIHGLPRARVPEFVELLPGYLELHAELVETGHHDEGGNSREG